MNKKKKENLHKMINILIAIILIVGMSMPIILSLINL
jgi:UDP-N-acetyl-D-mannosaminuronic acid transferase (WecB/TagA/CpsF family)